MFDEQALWSHRHSLRALALDLVGDEHRAEDVVQQAWIVALERPAGTLTSIGELGAWLRGVVRNLARKSIGREVRRRDIEAAAEPRAEAEVSAEQDFELRHELTGALRALPEPYRTTLHLRYFRDRTPTQIAAGDDCSVETVKTRLRRGLQLVRADLDARHDGRRELWCAPFVTLFRPPPALVAAPSSALVGAPAIVSGVLVVKALSLALLSVCALAALVIGLRSGDEAVASVDARPLVEAEAPNAESAPLTLNEPERARTREALVPNPTGPDVAPTTRAEAALGRLSVIDEDGAAVPGVRVSIEGAAGGEAVTGADGRALLELPERDAGLELALLFEAADLLPLRRTLVPPSGPDAELGEFVMIRGATLTGVVLDELGAPVPGAHVIVATTGMDLWRGVSSMLASYDPRQTAIADGAGRFELQGLAAGRMRVWAGAPGFVDGCSAPFELLGAQANPELEVRLGAAAAEDEIAGRVFVPDRLGDVELRVLYSYESREGGRTRRAPVAADGTFRVGLEHRAPHDLWLELEPTTWDEQRELYTGAPAVTGWRGSRVEGVAPGTTNLVLALERAPQVEVIVTDTAGAPLVACELGVTVFSGDDLAEITPWFREVTPPLELDVPTTGFVVTASAEGYDRVQLGPFYEDSVPPELRFELAPLASISGRVTAYGAPLSGARVEVYWAGSGEHVMTRNGFPLRMHGALVASAISAGDGSVELTVRESSEYFVLASGPGWATAELGPLQLGPGGVQEPLELELSAGGAIEGRLLLPAGEDPTGWVIGASRGDPRLHQLAVGADGAFRFDGLTPGAWQIARVLEDGGGTNLRSSRGPLTWVGDCVVTEGDTTHYDLDLRDAETCELRGHFEVTGLDFEGATLELRVKQDEPASGDRVDSGQLAADGTFELVAAGAGSYELLVRGESSMFLASIELKPGLNDWSQRVETGVLAGQADLTALPDPTMLVWIAAEGEPRSMTRLEHDDSGSFNAVVAAGPGRLHFATPELMEEAPPLEWPVLGEADVVSGATTVFAAED